MARRDEILEAIIDYAQMHLGNSPSQRDLMLEMKRRGHALSLSAIRQHLTKLEAEQRVVRRDGKLIVVGANWERPRQNHPER